MPHVLISRHILGATDDRLDEEYHDEEDYLEEKRENPKVEIDEGNWKDFIGRKDVYGNYLEYFQKRLAPLTPSEIPALLTSHLYPHLLPNLVSGAVHPLIHIGFGIEYLHKELIAEGLAEACMHDPSVAPVLALDNSKAVKGKTLESIFEEVRLDKRFDDIVRFKDGNKTDSVLKRGELVKEFAEKIWIDASTNKSTHITDDPQSLLKTFHSIFTHASHLLLQTALNPPHPPKPDFFLMHLLTSSISLRQLIPYLTPPQIQTLLHAHISVSLMHYVARGRPSLRPDLLSQYIPSKESKEGWSAVIALAVKNKDLHVPKVVRALKVLCDEGSEGGWVGEEEGKLILRGAQLV
ncbi:hypothetical protein HK097_004884, partial [Rhizophlyctis rosea]